MLHKLDVKTHYETM